MTNVSVVIPVYKSGPCLKELYRQLMPAMESICTQFEVIMVEDHGGDGSWELIKKLANQDSRLRGIQLSRNYGQHNALLCGIRAARCEVIVTMDDDLQNPVSEISVLLDKLAEGYDVVYGAPKQEQHSFFRNIASHLTKMTLQSAMGVESARNVSAFRAFRTRLREGFENYRSPYVSIDVLLTWATSSFTAVKVEHEIRYIGNSNYSLRKLVSHAFNMMTGFSVFPLQIASMVGFTFTLFGLGVLAWVLGRYFISGTSIPGFPFLASIIAIFSGAQLFAIGIFGEYLARIHFRTMDRPPYVTAQVSENNGDIPVQSSIDTTDITNA